MTENDFPMQVDTTEDRPPQPDFSSTHFNELKREKNPSRRKDCDCSLDSIEILVPIILYMDGISLDTHGKLNLTPLNMTLGIFNVKRRTKEYAWETIYFHPCAQLESSRQSKKASPL